MQENAEVKASLANSGLNYGQFVEKLKELSEREATLAEAEQDIADREGELKEQQAILDNALDELQEDRKALAAGEAALKKRKADQIAKINSQRADYGEAFSRLISYLRGSCGWSPSQRHHIVALLNPISLALIGKSYEFDWHSAHIVEANADGDETQSLAIDKQESQEADCPLDSSVNGHGIDKWLIQQTKKKKKPQLSKEQKEEIELISARLDYLYEQCPKLYKALDDSLDEGSPADLLNGLMYSLCECFSKLYPKEYAKVFDENKYMDEIFGSLLQAYPEFADIVFDKVEQIA